MSFWRGILWGAAIGGATGYVVALSLRSKPAEPPGKKIPEDKPPPTMVSRKCPVKGKRVLLIGDSYAAGLGSQMAHLAAACAAPYHYKGDVGSSVLKWQNESVLRPEIEKFDPNVVLISLGGNDMQRSPAQLKKAIDSLVAKIRGVGARALWIAPLTVPVKDTSGVREIWKKAVGDDWYDSEKLEIPRGSDGIHLAPSGYRYWAEQIWPWMATRTQ
jgi:hypothetical protein